MKGFATSQNPFITGTKPRRFLGQRMEMMKAAIVAADKRQFNPDWAKNKS